MPNTDRDSDYVIMHIEVNLLTLNRHDIDKSEKVR